MKCFRCGEEFELPDGKTDICATCEYELRQEADAEAMAAQAEAEAEAYERWRAGEE